MIEIERKWIVKPYGNWSAGADRHLDVVAGYISTDPEVRIRTRKDPDGTNHHYLALKLDSHGGRGLVRDEFEFPVNDADADQLWKHCHNMVRKTRWFFGGFELDQYHGKLSGLYIMEYELEDVNQTVPEFPDHVDEWREVTGEWAYKNSTLANLDAIAALQLVRESYQA